MAGGEECWMKEGSGGGKINYSADEKKTPI